MLCYSYAWNDGKVKVKALPDFPTYQKDKTDDKALVQSLWELFNEADIIVAHNGKAFDIKYTNGRFVSHGLVPPERYQVVDTLLVARANFKFNSNKLDDLGNLLHLGRKAETGGFELWLGCLDGNKQAWKKMRKYNKQDVVLLREVYHRLKGWMKGHPNLAVINGEHRVCPACGGSNVIKKGPGIIGTVIYQRYKCRECGHNSHTSLSDTKPLRS